MILQALTAYYEQLLAQGKVEAPGWDSRFKVSYELRLGPDGQLLALNDLRQEVPKGKKTVIAPRELPVPHRVKRASGVAATFLCVLSVGRRREGQARALPPVLRSLCRPPPQGARRRGLPCRQSHPRLF